MSDNERRGGHRPRLARRTNGLSRVAPEAGRGVVLVRGGAGSIGSDAAGRGIACHDPDVAIDRQRAIDGPIPSKRDATAPVLRDIEADLPFVYGGGVLGR